ncbi:MAK10-like protein [Tanacetum coccineum]|uniref:MAK10-like protein n=1 Tax=Tanacetum coccineum TaxID=301880 RepID=A0ABQ5E784_9ASTR
MGDANPLRTLRDYSKPSHEGYKNTIELPIGNNVVPLRSDTIRGKLHDKNAGESWEIIENLALHDHEGWNDSKNFVKSVKAISTPQNTSKTPDRRHLELEDQINLLLKGSRPTPRPSSTHVPQTYVEAVYSNPRPQNQNEPPKQNLFTFRERTDLNPQPQALGTTFEARVRDYMAAHTERRRDLRMSFSNSERRSRWLKCMKMLVKEAETENGAENRIKNEQIKRDEKGEGVEAPTSQPVEYYLKHRINEKLIEGAWPVYEAILKKKITRKEDIGGNFEITCNIGGLKRIAEDVLVDVAGFVYPMDFVILDIKEDEKRPFILGTPILTTAKAVIKFDKGTITLRSGKSKIGFHRIPETLCKVEKGIKNNIRPIAPTMTVNRLVFGIGGKDKTSPRKGNEVRPMEEQKLQK